MLAHRGMVENRRATLAVPEAERIVADLIDLAPGRSDLELEDELCARVGARIYEWEVGPLDDIVGPDIMAASMITAAAAAVRTALEASSGPDGWQASWRVLTAAIGIVPFSFRDKADQAVRELRGSPGGRELPGLTDRHTVTGSVLWTRNTYGNRFGIAAPISTAGAPHRWYLWDIDGCGHLVATVYSGYFPTSESALAAWREGVGESTAVESSFGPVDDLVLLAELLPGEEGFIRMGGESQEQLVEYHRCRRLAECVIDAVDSAGVVDSAELGAGVQGAEVSVGSVVEEFTAWLLAHRSGAQPHAGPDDSVAGLDELVAELAESWNLERPAALYNICSPHRLTQVTAHLRNYYVADFAEQLVALLPEWIFWLAERNGTPDDLVDRSQRTIEDIRANPGDQRDTTYDRVIE